MNFLRNNYYNKASKLYFIICFIVNSKGMYGGLIVRPVIGLHLILYDKTIILCMIKLQLSTSSGIYLHMTRKKGEAMAILEKIAHPPD